MKSIILCLLLCLTNCYVLADDDYVYGPDLFFGTWSTNISKAILIIDGEGSQFEISMIDTSSHKRKIEITDIHWDGETLSFTAYVKENDWKVRHSLKANTPCSLSDSIECPKLELDKLLWNKNQCQNPHAS